MNCCHQPAFSYELLIACIAVVISFISVALTYWTIRMQQKHNKLSVAPIPEISLSTIGGISIELKNNGSGPLICKELVTCDSSGIRKNHIKDFLPEGLHFKAFKYNTLRENFSILPNDSIKLISIEIDFKDDKQKENRIIAGNIIGDLTLKLCFTSMYNETFPIYNKPLIWIKNSIKNHT
jgi:hypothetical protein